MSTRNHIIHKQTIEAEVPAGKSAFAVQDRIRQIYYEKILPGLDELFSELGSTEAIIRMHRLDLDLGPVDGEQLEQQLVEKTIQAARKVLEERLRFEVGGHRDIPDLEVIPVNKSDTDIFLYFLEWGLLPWWSGVSELRELENRIMDKGTMPAKFPGEFQRLMKEVPVAGQRLLYQFPGRLLRLIYESCYPAGAGGRGATAGGRGAGAGGRGAGDVDAGGRTAGGAGDHDGNASADHRDEFDRWFSAFQEAAGTTPIHPRTNKGGTDGAASGRAGQKEKDGLTGMPVRTGSDKEQRSAVQPPESMGSADRATGSANAMNTGGTSAGDAGSDKAAKDHRGKEAQEGQTHRTEKSRQNAGVGEAAEAAGAGKADGRDAGNDPNARNLRNGRRGPGTEDGSEALYPESAGLVILHPFLSEFFTALHLRDGKGFRDEDARHKAVHLLGYLAYGEEEMEEQLLVFPKIICGMPLAEPVRRTGVISREEMEEADELLRAVIGYWKALPNTSAAGLRNSFLKRRGKLTRKNEGWQLDIEKKGWDVLLGKLPWGISIIRLPWMTEMIFVNFNT